MSDFGKAGLYDLPLAWPQALIELIDALRNYIRSDEAVANDLLMEGSITRAQYDEGMKSLEPMRVMLADLEAHGIDPDLHGMIKRKFKL